MYFIDKLNIYQDHLEQLPLVGSNGFLRLDLETGEINDNPTIFTKKHEGSFSSSLQIRCDGHRVSVCGNPSRWHRIDNLFGLKTIDECVSVYNGILATLGLPPFTKITQLSYLQGSYDQGANIRKTNGAVLTHVDFTRNHQVGYGNEQPFLKALSTQSINRSVPAYLYPNELTVEWFSKNIQGNGSSFRYVKCYAKASDLIRNQKKRCKDTDHDNIDYYQRLIDYCIQNGVVREEHSFKSKFLRQHKLNFYGEVTEEQFAEHLNCITEVRARLEVANMQYETIAQQLIDSGVCKNAHSANSTQNYYSLWLHGYQFDIRSSQYREHKSRLKKIGIDISIKLDISRSPLRLKTSQIIEVKQLEIPEWYRKPIANPARQSILTLVAA